MSANALTHPESLNIWSGIQPKCYETNIIPQIDAKKIEWRSLDEIREGKAQAEANEALNFFELFLQELSDAGLTKKNLQSIKNKAGGDSQDSQKDQIRAYLQILYARWSGKLDKSFGLAPISSQEKAALKDKIQEGALRKRSQRGH